MGISDLADKYPKNVERVGAREEVTARITESLQSRTRPEVLKKLNDLKVPAGSVNDMSDVFKAPQAVALVARDNTGQALGLRQIAWQGYGSNLNEDDLMKETRYAEHTAEVLREFLGMGESDIAELASA